MPHNLYLHSSLVQTRKIDRSDESIKAAIKFNLFDTSIALNLAFLVNAAILILAATAFFHRGYFQVAEIQDAYKLLNHIFGVLAPALFAIALIASGQSSTITGTLAGQIIMEGHINLRIQPWLRRLLTRLLAILPAVLTIVYFGESGLGNLIILSQVVLSLQLGFAVIPLIHFTSDKEKMGKFAIKPWVKVAAWASAALIVVLNGKLVLEQIQDWTTQFPSTAIWIYTLVVPVIIGVAVLLLYVFFKPIFFKHHGPTRKLVQVPHGVATAINDLTETAYTHIGVTIDFSKNDKDSIRHGLMQGGKKAQYTLIHIVETAAASYHGTEALDHETQSDKENLQQYVDSLNKLGYKANAKIGYGKAANAIVQIVKDEHIDFMVMGAHGHKALKDIIFGTTVDAVRHRVNVPILIVKPGQ
jgi:manganese transport protein